MLPTHSERAARVRFKHPIRVVTLDGPPRVIRTLTANVSTKGLFVRMPKPLPAGSRVALSLEASGRALAFAQAEVAWTRAQESELPGRFPGCGVRFTEFLHPRAKDLVDYLVDNLDRGKPLVLPKRGRRARWALIAAGAAGVFGVVGGLVLLWPAAPRPVVQVEDEVALAPLIAVAPEPLQVAVPRLMPELDLSAAPEPTPELREPDALAEPPPEVHLAAATAELPPTEAATPDEAPIEASATESPLADDAQAAPASSRPEAPSAPAEQAAPTPRHGAVTFPDGAVRRLSWSATGELVTLTPVLAPGATLTRAFVLSGPPRAVFDVSGAAPARGERFDLDAPHATGARLGKQPGSTRVVVDLSAEPTSTSLDDGALTLGF